MLLNGCEMSTTLPRSLPLYFCVYCSRSVSIRRTLVADVKGARIGSPLTAPLVFDDQASGHAANSEYRGCVSSTENLSSDQLRPNGPHFSRWPFSSPYSCSRLSAQSAASLNSVEPRGRGP